MACGAQPPSPRGDPCRASAPACCAPAPNALAEVSPRFAHMTDHALERVRAAKAAGQPVVGILCEFTPRELILAAGGVPVCLCGGAHAMIAPAEVDLPANLCPLIKSTYGYHLTRSNPFLELCDLVVAETTCDGKKKMYELMGETRPMHVLQLPSRSDEASRTLWRHEVRRLHAALQERFARPISEADLRAAIATMETERAARRDLAGLMRSERTPLTGRQVLELRSLASGDPADLAEYQRINAAPPAPRHSGVRVLLTGVPVPHGAEKVVDLIEGHGGLIVAHEHCSGLKPLEIRIDAQAADPLAAIADAYLHLPCSVMTRNDGRLDLIRRLAGEFRAQCVVELVWQACLTYDVEAVRVKRLCADLGLPYLRIGTDYAPGDTARIAVRLEALFEQVQAA
jgi:benzoyl-CoA reductase/2-hydroxyglutaryl-CoA dehydratase subunit BcrC/BadD/HgdB